MSLLAKIDVPLLNITGAVLGATSVAGYTCVPSSDGRYLAVKFKIGNDNTKVARSDAADAAPLGPHTIYLYDGANLVATYALPNKQPRTYFRLPLNPNANITPLYTPQQLSAMRLVFNIGVSDLHARALDPQVYDGPLAFPGMARSWHDTGERKELGIFSEWAAEWLRSGSQAALSTMLAVGESGGTAPLFYDDSSTGKLVDVIANPHANDFGPWNEDLHGTPHFLRANADPAQPTDITTAMDHPPEMSYVPGLITNDPFYCRNAQAYFNEFLLDNGGVTADGRPYLTVIEQRSLAWGLRSGAMAEILSARLEALGLLPADCLPSTYFATILKTTREVLLQPYMDNPELQLTRVFWSESAIAPWQQNYMSEALGFVVLSGRHPEYNDAYLWQLGNVVLQTSGLSGWPAGLPCSYWVWIGDPGARLKTWSEIWNAAKQPVASPGGQVGNIFTQAMCDALEIDQYNGGVIADSSQIEYSISAHGALSIALDLHARGIVDVFTPYPEIGQAYGNIHRFMYLKELTMENPDGTNTWFRDNNSGGWYPNTRNLFGFDQTKFAANTFTPGIIPSPLSTTPQPPAGGIHMAGTGNLNVGQTAHATITFDDGNGGPSQPPVNLAYTETPPGVVTVVADATGVNVTGVAAGNYTVTATADGGLTATLSGTVALPLAGALHLAWD